MTIPRDRDSTGVYDMGIKSEGVHTKGRQRDVVKRRMEKRVGREVAGSSSRSWSRRRVGGRGQI